MSESTALENARMLLGYWEAEYAKAWEAKEPERIGRCDVFIQQCKEMICLLELAAQARK